MRLDTLGMGDIISGEGRMEFLLEEGGSEGTTGGTQVQHFLGEGMEVTWTSEGDGRVALGPEEVLL